MGVAGDDSWGAPVHKEFSLPAAHYEYKFVLEPVGVHSRPGSPDY